jgi:hypothetical protein
MIHGMVSLQLNTNIADNYEKSIEYALKFYSDAELFLNKYDSYLLWGYSKNNERGRPNIVFKVAGSSPASIKITKTLESLGIGTNNTVTFTVAQETELILAKIEGRVEAVKKGIPLTTVYETNMGGRLDDHLREIFLESLLTRALKNTDKKNEILKELSINLGAWEEVKNEKSLVNKIACLSSRKYLRPINKKPLINILSKIGFPYNNKKRIKKYLDLLEEDIEYCGISVTKRIYEIFFCKKNKIKWINYLKIKNKLTEKQALEVIEGIDILPASKRKPKETLITMAETNMTHTEFPNHQTSIMKTSLEPQFKISDFKSSVEKIVEPQIISRLTEKWESIKEPFLKAYEITPKQKNLFKKVRIPQIEKYGTKGLQPNEWIKFGATKKTMTEFSKSYNEFRNKCVKFIKTNLA